MATGSCHLTASLRTASIEQHFNLGKIRFMNNISPALFKLPLVMAVSAFIGACSGGGSGTAPDVISSVPLPQLAFVSSEETIDLNNYTLTRQHRIPFVPELSAVTYNPDTDTLFMLGDGGTEIVQVNKTTAEKIDAMTLQPGDFVDTEGLAFVGNGQFVIIEEGRRQISLFTYRAGTIVARADVKTVKLGIDAVNDGIEGVAYDPSKSAYVLVKDKAPVSIFETTINFNLGTASNGSPDAINSVNLFDPALAGVSSFNDVAALSSVLASTAPDYSHLMVVSSRSGKVLKIDRSGKIFSDLDVGTLAQHEGITFDRQFNMYVTNERGAFGNPGEQEMWVYAPTRTASSVGLGSNLFLTFSANVVIGAGTLTIGNGTDDIRSMKVNDAARVSIVGNTVMINPKGKLKPNTKYTVQYGSGVFKEAGTGSLIAAATASALSFTTAIPLP